MRLDFNEANILMQNFKSPDAYAFINQLTLLIENTKEPILKDAAVSLRDKIMGLSDERVAEIYADLKKGVIVSTGMYNLLSDKQN